MNDFVDFSKKKSWTRSSARICAGQRKRSSAACRQGFLFSRSRPKSFILAAYVPGESTSGWCARPKAQGVISITVNNPILPDLLLCRSLQLITTSFIAGLAGSSRISV